MNQQRQSSAREHHFYVAIAKFRFHHPGHGIVSVRDPIKIKDAERYGLSPLILYGLTVARLPIRWTIMRRPRQLPNLLPDSRTQSYHPLQGAVKEGGRQIKLHTLIPTGFAPQESPGKMAWCIMNRLREITWTLARPGFHADYITH